MKTVMLGIDPGLSGAIVHVTSRRILSILDLADCRPNGRGLYEGSYLKPQPIVSYLQSHDPPRLIVIEDVHVQRTGESTVAMFKFGQVKGLLSGIVHSLFPDAVVWYVKPAVWKGSLGLSNDKSKSRVLAKKTWKKDAHLFERVKDTDRAEAALLALCGLKLIGEMK